MTHYFIFQNHYGHSETESTQKIVNIFGELEMLNKFQSFIEEAEDKIKCRVKVLPTFLEIFILEILQNLLFKYKKIQAQK